MTATAAHALPGTWIRFAPALGLASVGLVASLVQLGLVGCKFGPSRCAEYEPKYKILGSVLPVDELAARMLWCAAVFVFISAAIMVVAHAWALWREAKHEPSKRAASSTREDVIAGLALLAVVILIFLLTTNSYTPGDAFLRPAYTILPAETAVNVVDGVAVAAILSITLSACATLENPSNAIPNTEGKVARDKEVQRRAAVLARQLRRLRLLLVAGAIALVAGVLQVTSLYSWGATVAVDAVPPRQPAQAEAGGARGAIADGPSGVDAVKQQEGSDKPNAIEVHAKMIDTAGIMAGALFSLLLAGIFIPAFAVLGSQSRALADQGLADKPESDKATWLTDQGLSGSLPRQVASVLGVLAPVIVGGPGTALLKALFGAGS